jgi:Ni,Fe-hydrogenase maturation factor
MNSLHDAAVLGVGSCHGDDSIGWQVVDELADQNLPGLFVRKLASPMEIIDYLAVALEVHVVDAAIGVDEDTLVGCFDYLRESQRKLVESVTTASTHGIGVGQTLRLAETLGLPTDHVTVWFARGESYDSMAEPSATAIEATRLCTNAIMQELRNARSVTR